MLPVPDFATRELPAEPAAAQAADEEGVSADGRRARAAQLETETLVLPTVAPTEPTTEIEAVQPEVDGARSAAGPPGARGMVAAELEPDTRLGWNLRHPDPPPWRRPRSEAEPARCAVEAEPGQLQEPRRRRTRTAAAAEPEAEPVVESEPMVASEPWLQAEQDSDPGREPELAAEPEPAPVSEAAAVESEPSPC